MGECLAGLESLAGEQNDRMQFEGDFEAKRLDPVSPAERVRHHLPEPARTLPRPDEVLRPSHPEPPLLDATLRAQGLVGVEARPIFS